jgi:hypothetical protein
MRAKGLAFVMHLPHSSMRGPRRTTANHLDMRVSSLSTLVVNKRGRQTRMQPAFMSSQVDTVFSSQDIVVGLVFACMLAFFAAYLQSRRSQNDFVLWDQQVIKDEDAATETATETETDVVFDSWDEMKRPDNYVLYNTKLREAKSGRAKTKEATSEAPEKRWILLALLALFVPIFSFELFLTTSRQLICGGGNYPALLTDLARELCSPHLDVM